MVVEDNDINRAVIKTMLSHPRIDLTFANNGKKAVELYGTQKFNLILMDVSMPIMDGVTATRLIRQKEVVENLSRTPIICLTAHAMKKDRDEFLQAGMDDYLAKPVDKAKLIQVMEKWLRYQSKAA